LEMDEPGRKMIRGTDSHLLDWNGVHPDPGVTGGLPWCSHFFCL
jgi:hypothetical protein